MSIETKSVSETITVPTKSADCCGGPAPSDTGGCCALDAQVKAEGGAGCGCNEAPKRTARGGCCG
jgi:hypothetical protein